MGNTRADVRRGRLGLCWLCALCLLDMGLLDVSLGLCGRLL